MVAWPALENSCWPPLREQLAIKLNILRAPELVQAQLGDEAGCLGSALLAWEAFDTSAANRQARLGMTTYTCAHALTPDGLVHDVTIEVDDHLITSVTSGEPAAASAIDLGDVTVVPGFIDMHVHGVGLTASPKVRKPPLAPPGSIWGTGPQVCSRASPLRPWTN